MGRIIIFKKMLKVKVKTFLWRWVINENGEREKKK